MHVEVIRSERRFKTVAARVQDGVLRVSIPAGFTLAEEAHWVDAMQQRFRRQEQSERIDLNQRARRLAARHDLAEPAEVLWSERQKTRWGSCTPATGRVRIATRIAGFPSWVVDYVIVHELAHLTFPDHGPQFWGLVNRYPLAERARGYLIAKSDGV